MNNKIFVANQNKYYGWPYNYIIMGVYKNFQEGNIEFFVLMFFK